MALNLPGVYRRGDVVRADFDPVEGLEQSGVRPALVLSPEGTNRHSPLVILVPLTTKNLDRIYPFEVLIEPNEVVKRRSKVLLLQVRAMSKTRVSNFYGQLSDDTMNAVDAALQIAVGLEKI